MDVYRIIHILLLLFLLTSCDIFSSNNNDERFFEFTHQDEEIDYIFTAKTSDPEVIQKVENQLSLPFEQRNMHINGNIERGTEDYNSNWSWHFVPDIWNLVEISVEVCDGRPRMVEDDLDYWVDQVGFFCPWSARVLREVDN